MKRAFIILLIVFSILAVAVGLTFTAATLDTGGAPTPAPLPPFPADPVTASVVHTGTMEARAAFSYRGGAFSDKRDFVMPAMLIQHPDGNLLIDAGLGENALAHLSGEPLLMRVLSKAHPGTPAARQLADQSVDAILLTHAHWDHVSGVEDFPDTPVLTTAEEVQFIQSGHEAGRLAREILAAEDRRVVPLEFRNAPFMGFDSSHDYFGDGSVVIVPAPGHTPGSVWIFVSTSKQDRYLLVGDTVWQHEGFEIPAEKPWMARRRVDFDVEATRDRIRTLYHLARTGEWHILPAHDQDAWSSVPAYQPPP